IFALYYLFGDGADFAMYGGTAYVNIRPAAFAAALLPAAAVVLGAYRIFSTGDGITRQVAEVELLIEGRRFTGRGLIDTGASLCEPISGRQAVIVQRSLVAPLYPIPPPGGEGGVRMVPFSTVAGPGFLPAVRCDAAVTLKGRRIVHRGLYAALSEQPLSPDGSYQIILGHAIMAGVEEGELFHETCRKI
ncbi:MAG TPA: sigma-E processing peptidase SpoIIGA, partial [Terriglobales bacterium]|nr:sigma-E processing peptidase SpoIIGA [Terriglobales bacterium]